MLQSGANSLLAATEANSSLRLCQLELDSLHCQFLELAVAGLVNPLVVSLGKVTLKNTPSLLFLWLI
jgi:hypothetical protein